MCRSRLPGYGRTERISIGSIASRDGRSGQLRLLLRERGALPGDQHAAVPQQRRGELRQGRRAAHRPGGDRVVGLPALPGGPLLGALADHRRVLEAHPLDRLAQELALARNRLDQVDPRPRQAGRQDQARQARAAAEVGDPAAPSESGSNSSPLSESAMWTSRARRRWRPRSGRAGSAEQLEQRLQRGLGGGRGCAQSETSGATTT